MFSAVTRIGDPGSSRNLIAGRATAITVPAVMLESYMKLPGSMPSMSDRNAATSIAEMSSKSSQSLELMMIDVASKPSVLRSEERRVGKDYRVTGGAEPWTKIYVSGATYTHVSG